MSSAPYDFKTGVKGFPACGPEILNQPWVSLQEANFLKEFAKVERFHEASRFDLEDFQREISEIDDIINGQGIFYTNTKGVATTNGNTNLTRLQEAIEKTGQFLWKKEHFDHNIIESAIILYNNHLEEAISRYISSEMRNAISEYNSNNPKEYKYKGTDGDGNQIWDPVYDFINCSTNDITSFTSLRSCEMKRALENAKYGKTSINIPIRPSNTGGKN